MRARGVDAPGRPENCGSEGEKESSASQSRNSNVSSLVGGLVEAGCSGAEKGLSLVGGRRHGASCSMTKAPSAHKDGPVLECGSASSDSVRACSNSETNSAGSDGSEGNFLK